MGLARMDDARVRGEIARWLLDHGLLIWIGGLIVVFSFLNSHFLTVANLRTVFEQNAAMAIVSVGMTFAIISRNIDLAPGSLIALAGVIMGLTFQATGSILLAIVASLLGAVAVDLFNGLLIAQLRMDPLIVTLAAWMWCRGLAISLTRAHSIVLRNSVLAFLRNADFGGISLPIALVMLCFLAGWFLLDRTRIGRYAYAMGGDETAARQAGVNTAHYKLLLFAFFGLLAGIGAVVNVSLLGAAAPDAAYGLELDAIVAVIIGGNPFQGGDGNVGRTALGVLFIALLNNGLSSLGMRDAYFYAYKGLAIILALASEAVGRRLLFGGKSQAVSG